MIDARTQYDVLDDGSLFAAHRHVGVRLIRRGATSLILFVVDEAHGTTLSVEIPVALAETVSTMLAAFARPASDQ
jgi:hypothetical protein